MCTCSFATCHLIERSQYFLLAVTSLDSKKYFQLLNEVYSEPLFKLFLKKPFFRMFKEAVRRGQEERKKHQGEEK